MPGDYLFPKRLFKDGEPLDTVELNDALQVAAERLNGHLGPHNIRAPLDPALSAAAGTFFKTKIATVDVDPLMAHASGSSSGKSPQPDAPGTFLLEQETGWTPVTGSEDMIVEVATGASSLSITAQATHCYAGKYDGSNAAYETTVPIFNDPELKNGLLGKSAAALLEVTVTFDSYVRTVSFGITDARNFDSLANQSKEIARKIASDRRFNEEYVVSAEGRVLTFRSKTTASAASTIQIRYISLSGPVINQPVSMSVIADGSAPSASQSLDSLDSCSPFPSPVAVLYYPAQIQYALRVDGVVITETITGRFDNERAPLTPARIVNPRDESSPVGSAGISGPGLAAFRERPDAINIPMFSVRLTASIDVEPGDHVVELVVRRVPTGRRRSFTPPPPEVGAPVSGTTYIPDESRVYIYSRQMSVTDIPIEPIDSAVFGTPAVVSSFKDEDVVTKKSLVDDRLQKVASEINDIQSFQVARGAINGDHLEGFSSVLATAASQNFSTPKVTSTSFPFEYPTAGSRSFSASQDLFRVGSLWKLLDAALLSDSLDGTSTPLECVLTIEANVFIERLVHKTLKQNQMHLAAAVFLIALFDADQGAYYFFRPSLAWVNSNNYIAYQTDKTTTAMSPHSSTIGLNYLSRYGENGSNTVTSGDAPGDYVDVPVTAYIDFSGVDAAGNSKALTRRVTSVAVFAAAAWMGSDSADAPASFIPSSTTINAVAMKS